MIKLVLLFILIVNTVFAASLKGVEEALKGGTKAADAAANSGKDDDEFYYNTKAYKMANGYYIGCTYEDCSDLKNIYICKTLTSIPGTCYGVINEAAGCSRTAVFYDCYNYKGEFVGYKEPTLVSPFGGSEKNEIDVVVNANDSSCYFGAYGEEKTYTSIRKRVIKIPRNSKVQKENGRCLVGAGWCPCQDYVPEAPKPNPSSSNTSYSSKRCQRKLPSVQWKRSSDGWTTPLNSYNIEKYCAKTTCQEAYNDEKKPKCDRRHDYWRSCRNEILADLKSYYQKSFEPVSDTLNFC